MSSHEPTVVEICDIQVKYFLFYYLVQGMLLILG